MASYLWKKLSDKERKEIEEQAKEIMLGFGERLEGLPSIPDVSLERDDFERAEGVGDKTEINRRLMFENAPESSGDFIVAEKGGWVE